MRMRVEFAEGQMLRVAGPLRARVVYGQVMVLGAIYERGEVFEVSRHRSYAVKALTESCVELELGEHACIERPSPDEEVLDKWVAAVDSILRAGCRKVMVLGPTDSGKSSLVALVANRALLRGLRVGVVDADIGQADVGPPTTVSAAEVKNKLLWLRELRAEQLRFVGYISPQRVERRIVAAVVELVNYLTSRGIDVVVIDTDGWVQGLQSIEYKVEMARFAGVDAVIVVGGDEYLEQATRSMLGHVPCGVLSLPSPKVRRVRDRADRRELRSEAYRRYLQPLYEREIDLSTVAVQGACFFSGVRLRETKIDEFSRILKVKVEAASETHDTVYIVTEGQADPEGVSKLARMLSKQVYILDKTLVPGALVALVGESGREEALGLVQSIDLRSMKAKILTSYDGPVKAIIFGGVRLTKEFEETGKPVRCII